MPRVRRLRSTRLALLLAATAATMLVFLAGSASASAAVDFSEGVEFTLESTPGAEAIGDLNGDGNEDLVATNRESGTVSVLLGNGDGTFAPQVSYPVGVHPNSVAIGDFNGDHVPDLAVVNEGSGDISILLGNGNGTFAPAISVPDGNFTYPLGIAVGDFNGDGKEDLAVANSGREEVAILLGNGNGTFTPGQTMPTGRTPYAVVAADFNGDGTLDLATVSYSEDDVWVYLGNGNGTFGPGTTYAVGGSPQSLAVGDFNGDGVPDLVTADTTEEDVSVLIGAGDGSFAPQVTYPVGSGPLSVAVGDFDGDGNADIAVANAGGRTIAILAGNGDGTFAPAKAFRYPETPTVLGAGDFNGDGKDDLAVVQEYPGNGRVLLAGPEPTFSAAASGPVAFGEDVADTATIAGAAPTGTITFNAYGPEDERCEFVPAYTGTVPVNGDGQYTSPFNPEYPGTYRWIAEYSGDAHNGRAVGACNDANQSSLVNKLMPTMTTRASGPVTIGEEIADTATLTGGSNLEGTITFLAYGPDDATCAGAPAFESAAVTVEGDGDYASPSFTPSAAGTYRWVAEYSGDEFNEALAGACNAANESVAVKATTTTSLDAGPDHAPSGTAVTLTAKVTGADPTGTVTFSDGEDTVGSAAVGADGTASLTTTALAAGPHAFIAAYLGDDHNLPSSSSAVALTVDAKPEEKRSGGGSNPGSNGQSTPTPPPAPKVTFGFRPPPASNPRQGYRYTFRLSDSAAGSTFYCRLGSRPFKRCKSPVSYPHLTAGHHVFTVKAVAPNGQAARKIVRFVAGNQR